MTAKPFYVLEHHTKPGQVEGVTDALMADGAPLEEAPVCRVCGRSRGMLTQAPPHPVEIEIVGARPGDLAFMVSAQQLLVSERFKRLYEESDLVGLDIREPAEIVKLSGNRRAMALVPIYYYTRVMATTTRVDHEASGTIFPNPDEYCPACNQTGMVDAMERVVIDGGSWDGHDIFAPLGLAEFVVSDRFKDFCETNRISNCLLVPAEDYSFDYYPERRASS